MRSEELAVCVVGEILDNEVTEGEGEVDRES